MKAKNMYVPEKGKQEIVKGLELEFSVRNIKNAANNLAVTQNGYSKKAVNYYDAIITRALEKIHLPKGIKPPKFVLFHGGKDLLRETFGAYDPTINTVFLDSSTFGEKAVIRKLKRVNAPYLKNEFPKYFAVDDNALSPIYHELGHFKHHYHITHYAETHDISFKESKTKFNEKLVEYIEKKGYNISKDISGYAGGSFEVEHIDTSFTNELVAESYALYLANKNNGLANYIIKLLEQEGW